MVNLMILVSPFQLRTFCDFKNNYLGFVVVFAGRRVTLGQLYQVFLFSLSVVIQNTATSGYVLIQTAGLEDAGFSDLVSLLVV